MIGYVTLSGVDNAPGQLDRVMVQVADHLRTKGLDVHGAIQRNTHTQGQIRCDMDLEILPHGQRIRISQSLGEHAQGCRLDANAMAQAVAAVETTLEKGAPDVVVLNKFGKQEIEGSGFRDVLAACTQLGVTVVVGVGPAHLDAFLEYCDGLCFPLPHGVNAIVDRVVQDVET